MLNEHLRGLLTVTIGLIHTSCTSKGLIGRRFKMGYWEEKRRYEELKEKKKVCTNCGKQGKMKASCQYKGFLGQCGKTETNLAGNMIAFQTHNNLCSNCAHKCKHCGKYFCPKHILNHKCNGGYQEESEDSWECDFCKEEFTLNKKEEKELEEKGGVRIKCPYCKNIVICEN